MKSLIALVLTLSSLGAWGEVITVKKMNFFGGQDYWMEFGINKDLGRAWVEIKSKSNSDRRSFVNTERVAVQGLSFKDDQIVFTSADVETVCANVVRRGPWVFSYDDIQETGNCNLGIQNVRETYDDGFYITERVVKHFNLTIF